jgi:hypothetical protein
MVRLQVPAVSRTENVPPLSGNLFLFADPQLTTTWQSGMIASAAVDAIIYRNALLAFKEEFP